MEAKMQPAPSGNTVDDAEIERFSRIASEWWNESGKFKPLHRINPLRIQWIVEQVAGSSIHNSEGHASTPPLSGLTLLDIGCGGGLIAEPMARLGARVTAIDASEKNIAVASLHAEQSGLGIDYRCGSAEALLAQQQTPAYDVVLALEVIEHVADVGAFIAAAVALLKPGGTLIVTTLNRTAKSYALAIVGAEYILRWLPRGTHDWKKFLKPSELAAQLRQHDMAIASMTGMVMHPLTGEWRLDARDVSVNYLLSSKKPVRT